MHPFPLPFDIIYVQYYAMMCVNLGKAELILCCVILFLSFKFQIFSVEILLVSM